ncbi:MAG: radical SAM protein [bacterium]
MPNLIKKKSLKQLKEERSFFGKKYTRQELKVALVFPNTYYLGMSNLGYLTIFNLLNQREDTYCERVFLPEGTDYFEHTRTNPPLLSLESQTSLKNFDLIAFSIPFEGDYLNLLKILTLANLPLLSKERSFPLVIAGGITCFSNPEPLSDFIDLFILGEGEEILPEFIDTYKEIKDKPKETILKSLSQKQGIYVPSLFNIFYDQRGKILKVEGKKDNLKRIFAKNINSPYNQSLIITPNTAFKNQYLTEITRGCKQGCRFCLTGAIYRPFRFKEKKLIIFQAKLALQHTDKIGLIGPNICEHPEIEDLCQELSALGFKISTSSLESISLSSQLTSFLSQETITIAPECGSDQLRFSMNKEITNQSILAKLKELKSIAKLKLYFIIGLPQESLDEVREIINFVEKIKELNPSRKLVLSINPFIPKPNTALQWLDMEDEDTLRLKINLLKTHFRGKVKLSLESIRLSILQGILARGDRKLGRLLTTLLKKEQNIKEAFQQSNLPYSFYRFRNFEDYEILPWDHLNCGSNKEFLLKEKERYFKKITS